MPIVHHLENIENLIQRQTQRLLLVRLQKGDFEVLDDLLTQTHTYFYNLLACMLGPNIDSNNILKHAFHRFIQIRDRLDSHREFVPILGRIIFEEAASAAQKEKKRMRLTFSRDEQEAYIVNLFQSLPLQQQIVLHFRIVGAMHYEDIAISLRIRQSDVFSHLAEGRQLIYNSLYKKRLIANPEHIDVEEQKIILAHPDLLELKKYAPKISKNFENSANLHHFLDQVRLVDMMVRNALATVSNESAKLASRRRHVLQYLRQELRNEQAPQQPLDNTKSLKFRPVWRTAFALVVAVASFFLWNLYKPALQQLTSPQIIQNSTLPIFTNTTEASSTKAVPDNANTGNGVPIVADKIDTALLNGHSRLAHRNGSIEPEFELQTHGLSEKREEVSGAMTVTMRSPHALNPYAATLRKQDRIPSIANRIKLWENFLETTADSSMYRPHIIENLAELYLQAADSSNDALHLADVVAWFDMHEQILASFYGDSVYTSMQDSLQLALQAARLGK